MPVILSILNPSGITTDNSSRTKEWIFVSVMMIILVIAAVWCLLSGGERNLSDTFFFLVRMAIVGIFLFIAAFFIMIKY